MPRRNLPHYLDAILLQINKAEHSNTELDLHDPDHPKPFSAKIRLLKAFFKKHKSLAQYNEAVATFASGLSKLSKTRNQLAHWILSDSAPTEQKFTLTGFQFFKQTNFVLKSEIIQMAEIEHFTKMVNLAHYGLCDVSRELFTTDALEKLRMPQQPSRRWWRRILDRLFR